MVPVVGNGGDAPSPGHPTAAPLTAGLALSAALSVSAVPEAADGGTAARAAVGEGANAVASNGRFAL